MTIQREPAGGINHAIANMREAIGAEFAKQAGAWLDSISADQAATIAAALDDAAALTIDAITNPDNPSARVELGYVLSTLASEAALAQYQAAQAIQSAIRAVIDRAIGLALTAALSAIATVQPQSAPSAPA